MAILDVVKRECSLTNCNAEMEQVLTDYIEEGQAFLERYCRDLNYEKAGQERTLLVEYVRYRLASALDDFKVNYFTEILSLSNRGLAQESDDDPTIIDQLKEQIQALSELMESIQAELSTAKSELGGKIDGVDKKLDTTNSNLTAQGAKLNSLEESDRGQSSALEVLQQSDEAQKAKLTSLEKKGTETDEAIKALQAKDTETDKAIEGLKAKDKEQDEAIKQAGTSQEVLDEIEQLKQELENDITLLQQSDESTASAIQDLQAKDVEQGAKLDTLESGLSTAETNIEGLQASDQSQEAKLTSLEEKDSQTDIAIQALQAKDVEQDEAIANAGGGGIDGGFVDEDGTLHLTYKEEEQAAIETPYELATYTVTYYDYDQTKVLFTEKVIKGHDAMYSEEIPKDPDRYEYTFAGWSKTRGGQADPKAQKEVNSDLSLYAAYSTASKTYTVYFYNGDELLETAENVGYDGMALYSGDTSALVNHYGTGAFDSWYPSNSNIKGNTSCYARFKLEFEDIEIEDDWETIISNIEAGTHKDRYKIGNYKPLDLGSEGIANMQLIGTYVDDKADGSGRASTTWVSKNLLKTDYIYNNNKTITKKEMDFGKLWIKENDYYKCIPYDFENKTVTAKFAITPANGRTIVSYNMTADCDDNFQLRATNVADTSYISSTKKTNGWQTWYLNQKDETQPIEVTASYTYPTFPSAYIRVGTAYVKFDDSTVVESFTTDPVKYNVTTELKDGTGVLGGWKSSYLRNQLASKILPLIPEPVKSNIVQVVKSQPAIEIKETNIGLTERQAGQKTNDSLWILSYEELTGNRYYGRLSNVEGYSTKLDQSGTAKDWWLRSTDSWSSEWYYDTTGKAKSTGPLSSLKKFIALGFCL